MMLPATTPTTPNASSAAAKAISLTGVVHVGHADADAAAEGSCDLRLGRIEKSAGRRAETQACEAGKGDTRRSVGWRHAAAVARSRLRILTF
jgi:hypothetical protein